MRSFDCGSPPRRLTLIFLVILSTSTATSQCSGEWIDLDTPSSACHTRGLDAPYSLVFSDEFELDGRSFIDGADARWTAQDTSPGGNAQVNLYNSTLPRTLNGKLQLPVIKKYSNVNQLPKYYQTGSVQSWNKFCFTQGIAEISAKLPGPAHSPGLWPAFWLMGNLARATIETSSDGIWPFSFDTCVPPDDETACAGVQCRAQRISACDPAPGHGLHPNHGRGSPEIDVLEAMGGSIRAHYAEDECGALRSNALRSHLQMPRPHISGSYQVAPGVPTNSTQRPTDRCLAAASTWYPYEINEAQRTWRYHGAMLPSANFSVMPTFEFYGGQRPTPRSVAHHMPPPLMPPPSTQLLHSARADPSLVKVRSSTVKVR